MNQRHDREEVCILKAEDQRQLRVANRKAPFSAMRPEQIYHQWRIQAVWKGDSLSIAKLRDRKQLLLMSCMEKIMVRSSTYGGKVG